MLLFQWVVNVMVISKGYCSVVLGHPVFALVDDFIIIDGCVHTIVHVVSSFGQVNTETAGSSEWSTLLKHMSSRSGTTTWCLVKDVFVIGDNGYRLKVNLDKENLCVILTVSIIVSVNFVNCLLEVHLF